MRYLLYCIFHNIEDECMEDIRGIGGKPVSIVTESSLGAAVSHIEDFELIPDVSRVMAYERVIETFWANRDIIPMRYGSTFSRETDVISHLDAYREGYAKVLNELTGCVEIGVRVLLSKSDTTSVAKQSAGSDPLVRKSGRSYLESRRVRYDLQDSLSGEVEVLVQRLHGTFAGLFVKSKVEGPRMGTHSVLSIYYLIRRDHLDPFREAFKKLSSEEHARLLLSGPWPPYNFVTEQDLKS